MSGNGGRGTTRTTDVTVTKAGPLTTREVRSFVRPASERDSKDDGRTRSRDDAILLLLLHGSWNRLVLGPGEENGDYSLSRVFSQLIRGLERRRRNFASDLNVDVSVGSILVDADDETLEFCIGDGVNGDDEGGGTTTGAPSLVCPAKLPALAVLRVAAKPPGGEDELRAPRVLGYVDVDPNELLLPPLATSSRPHPGGFYESMWGAIRELLRRRTTPTGLPRGAEESEDKDGWEEEECLRIFVAGDRSQVGKSSVCMGLLGSLLRLGYPPSSLAYIKPATQCEAPQLIASFCESHGIACVPVGPVVYFRGFTREFLAGRTEGSDVLLGRAADAVDDLARGKRRVVVIDGVGYPAVGSICGTSNASVAAACGYPSPPRREKGEDRDGGGDRTPAPVLLVGKSGVGDAVDSFNLNATYLESNGIPVLGAVFNRLSLDEKNYYSLDKCRVPVTEYFRRNRPNQEAFGFVPEVPGIARAREDGNHGDEEALKNAEEFVDVFHRRVDVKAIVDAARKVRDRWTPPARTKRPHGLPPSTSVAGGPEEVGNGQPKRMKVMGNGSSSAPVGLPPNGILTREQIENAAKAAGAAGG